MRATLAFDLPDEQIEFDTACAAAAYRGILAEVMEQIRSWRKCGHTFKTPDQGLEAVRVMIADQIARNHVPWE